MSKEFKATDLAPKVMDCTCNHEYQDNRYGKGKRLHTVRPNYGTNGAAVCTVCGSQKNL